MKKWTAICVPFISAAACSATVPPVREPVRAAIYPGSEWERIATPEAAGYSSLRLEALRVSLAAGPTTGMLIVVGGRVLFEYGNTIETSYVASVRKSVVSMLYGKYVTSGRIPLEKSLR